MSEASFSDATSTAYLAMSAVGELRVGPVIGLRSAIIPEFKSYVFKANDEDEFIKQMNNVVEGASKNINLDYIKKMFSWINVE